MKKIILFIIPVIILAASCDNKTKTDNGTASVSKDSTTAGQSMKSDVDTTTSGTPTSPAMVFDDKTLNPLGGAMVSAAIGTQVVQTVTSDAKGNYSFTKLATGQTYTYTAGKSGYLNTVASGVYQGTNSLPAMALKQ